MDKYKFGNHIYRLRESKGLTQSDLAQILGVSDKAVSKWENGQSVPRMETFETLATALDTTVQTLLAISKEGTTVVYLKNECCPLINLETNGKSISLKSNESTYIEVENKSFTIKISGDFTVDELNRELSEISKEEKGLKNKIAVKLTKKLVSYASKAFLLVDCTYLCENFCDGQIINITAEDLNLGDVAYTYEDFVMYYPKPESNGMTFTLLRAQGKNTSEYVKRMKKSGFTADLGLDFITMALSYPLRGLYFKHLCKPHIIKKHILNAEKIKAKNARKKSIGCMSLLGILFIVLCVAGLLDIFLTPYTTPAIVSADYSSVSYDDEIYNRIDSLPSDAKPDLFLNAEFFENAINAGDSLLDKWADDCKVQLFTDSKGNKYLWLIEDYTDTVLTQEMSYEDFDEVYVYLKAYE